MKNNTTPLLYAILAISIAILIVGIYAIVTEEQLHQKADKVLDTVENIEKKMKELEKEFPND